MKASIVALAGCGLLLGAMAGAGGVALVQGISRARGDDQRVSQSRRRPAPTGSSCVTAPTSTTSASAAPA